MPNSAGPLCLFAARSQLRSLLKVREALLNLWVYSPSSKSNPS
uniref:Uncharacterized protein n=1 Tax=Arundo donax TaxID=35708 RepID=A0A0A9C1D0_ARUDO